MKILWIFWGHHNIALYLGIIYIVLGSSLKVKVQNGRYFYGLVKFHFFGGAGGWGVGGGA